MKITGSRNVEKDHTEQFKSWFLRKAFELRESGDSKMTDEVFALANGCMPTALSYTTCVVNGVKYTTYDRDINRITQNSGVFVPGLNDEPFYGVLQDVVVIQYIRGCSVVLMKCKWFDTDRIKKRILTYQNITSIYTGAEWYKDDPFILSTQAQSVFYTDDLVNGSNWKVAHLHTARHIWDLPEDVEDEAHQEVSSANFELFVELPVVDGMPYRRSDTSADVVVNGNNIVELDDDVEDDNETVDLEVDDTVVEYVDSDDESDEGTDTMVDIAESTESDDDSE